MPIASRYRLLTSIVVPRPIAWITTVDDEGDVNAAPFSCFNLMGYDPPLVAIGIQSHPDGQRKRSFRNIVATGELVVNLVAYGSASAMAASAAGDVGGCALVGSAMVTPPRLAAAPVALECRLFELAAQNDTQVVVIAEILSVHVSEAHVIDAAQGAVDTAALDLVGRLEGPAWYVRCDDRFSLDARTD